ncbi:MAG: hypothetical protein JNL08_14540 [Planctomycetes bacterium]|nr:hypothetical protein [Planctomycetota bacterium]
MLRRSFQLLLVATLLALAGIVAYATAGIHDAGEMLDEAERLAQGGAHATAIARLDLAERSPRVQRDPALRERLLRLRLAAQTALENPRGALLDVDKLLQDRDGDDRELQLERIQLQIEVGDVAAARQAARSFAAAHPDDARGLELAGAACLAACRDTVAALRTTIERDAGPEQQAAALAAFATYIHRPDGDAEVGQSLARLAALYALDTRLAATWPGVERDLVARRDEVQEALAFCRTSLEAGGAPGTAVVTWAEALAASGRVDDALVACEIHRRRPHDAGNAAAGLVGALTLMQRGADAAAVALSDRFLPGQQLQPRLDAGVLGAAAPDLMLARSIAGWRLGDANIPRRTLGALGLLHQAGLRIPKQLHLSAGLMHYLGQVGQDSPIDVKNGEVNLRHVTRLLLDESLPPTWPDLVDIAMSLRLDLMPKLGSTDAEILAVFADWQEARPRNLVPRLRFARYLLEQRRPAAALAVLAEAEALAPHDAELFDLKLAAVRAEGERTGQDGEALLAQCLRTGRIAAETSVPLQHVLCAQAALARKRWGIARGSAQAAIDAFPHWTLPRRLAVEALLGAGQAADAAQEVQRLLVLFPADAATAHLALRAQRAAGLPTVELLATAMPLCAPDAALRTEILRAALADDPASAAQFARPGQAEHPAPPELRLLASRALARRGEVVEARRLLDGVLGEIDGLPPAVRADLTAAVTAWIEVASGFRDDASLLPQVTMMLARTDLRHADDAAPLQATAALLAASHPQTALELQRRALAIAAPNGRTGAAFALAGRLALRCGQPRLAEDYWTAALAFADGADTAEDLARLLLAAGRTERALQVHALVPAPTDAALAARLGDLQRAAIVLAAALIEDPADLLPQATAAAFGMPSRCAWPPGDAAATEARLEALALLHDDDLGAEALVRLRGLPEAAAPTPTLQLLLARAQLAVGDHAAAETLHLAVRASAPGPLLWRELARAATDPTHRLAPALDEAVCAAVTTGDFGGSTPATVFGLQRLIAALDRTGLAEMAADTRRRLWLLLPQRAIRDAADLAAVARLADPYEAWQVLDQALPAIPAALHGAWAEQCAARADAVVAARGAAAADVYGRVREHVARHGAFGSLVDFLLRHGPTFPDLQPDATAARALLLAQIERTATGRDDARWLARSVDHLLATAGPAPTRDDLEAALRRHPTSLPLWLQRAAVLAQLQRAEAGLDDLRRVLAHADAPAAMLQFLILVGAAGELRAGDQRCFESLPPALLASPDGALAQGLVRLRLGEPDVALPFLLRTEPRADGLHLYALALAHLQSKAADGGTRARELFLQLAADYPSSSLARNAGSFARQLSPR